MNTTRISIFNVFGILAIAAAAVSCAFAEPEDIPLVKLGAIEKEYVVEAEASTFDIDIYTNGPYHIEYIEEVDTLSKILILANKRDLYDIKGITPRSDEILELILRNYTGLYADYVTIDELSIAYKFNIPLQDIYDTLIFLNKQHVIHYIPRRRTAYIYFPCSRVEPRHLEITKEVYEKGKERLEKRINSIIAYAENDSTCREKMILE